MLPSVRLSATSLSRTRRHAPQLKLLVIALTAALFLTTSCSPEDSLSNGSGQALQYAESLRASDNLAHGSLEIPSGATLSRVSAVARIYRFVGYSVPAIDCADLVRLTRQSSEPPLWKFQSLCAIDPSTGTKNSQVLSDEESIVVGDLAIPPPESITNTDSVAELLALVDGLACKDEEQTITEDHKIAVIDAVRSHPLIAAEAIADLHITASGVSPLVTSNDIDDLNRRVESDGCNDWIFAESLAVKYLVASGFSAPANLELIEECASDSRAAIDDVEAIATALKFGLSEESVRTLIRGNQSFFDQVLRFESTYVTEASTPVGKGSASATRDLVQYLRLNDVTSVPSWIGEGVLDATMTEQVESTRIDLLYLCISLHLACDPDFVSVAKTELSDAISSIDFVASDDESNARLLETATLVGISIPFTCDEAKRAEWFADAPQSLAMIASTSKTCADVGMYSEEELQSNIVKSLQQLNPQRALAFVYLAMLNDSSVSNPDFSDFCEENFKKLWASLRASEGDDDLVQARLLSVELIKAKLENWTKL